MQRTLLLVALCLPTATTAAPPVAGGPATQGLAAERTCLNRAPRWADRTSRKAEFKRLGELPPGAMVLGVLHQVEGCTRPVIVHYGYGAVRSSKPGTAQ